MGCVAGLSLLTRVTFGLALYLATGLLILRLAVEMAGKIDPHTDGRSAASPTARLPISICRAMFSARFLWPITVLLFFAAVTGTVNYMRWQNPLTFSDLRLSLPYLTAPRRMDLLVQYGVFNLSRIGITLSYYFFPILLFKNADGTLFFHDSHYRLMDGFELPPGSFLISEPLILLLAIIGTRALLRRCHPPLDQPAARLIASALTVPSLMILAFLYASFRYRAEFYPLFEFLGFIGCMTVVWHLPAPPALSPRVAWTLSVVSIACAHLSLIMYKLSPFGNVDTEIGGGIFQFYADQISRLVSRWF